MTANPFHPVGAAIGRSSDAAESCGLVTDDPSYQAAILVLDYLFDLGERKTIAQAETFRTLAERARNHEIRQGWALP